MEEGIVVEKPIRVFIADASAEFCTLLTTALEQEDDFAVAGTALRGDVAYERLRSAEADLLIADLLLPGLDGLSLLRRLRDEGRLPSTIVVSGFCNDRIARLLSTLADNYLPKPCRTEELLRHMRDLVGGTGSAFAREYDGIVTRALIDFGFPPHLDGFRYIREGILRTLADRTLLRGVTKSLYRDIAKCFGTNATCVERSIRSAIEHAWVRYDSQVRRMRFGRLFDAYEKAPSNVPFLTAMTEYVESLCEQEEMHG